VKLISTTSDLGGEQTPTPHMLRLSDAGLYNA
jgi:hypothetical protein